MGRKLRVLLAEDEVNWIDTIETKLNTLLGHDGYDYTLAYNSTDALKAIKASADSGAYFDVVLADAKLPEGATAGEAILIAAREACPRTVLFLVSQYHGLQEVMNLMARQRPFNVIGISKTGLEDPKDSYFEAAFRGELARWTTETARHIEPAQKSDLRSALTRGSHITGEEKVIALNEEWRLKDLFFLYWTAPPKIDAILDCLSLNLSVAFSEALGIFGVKQITHRRETGPFYYSLDTRELHEKVSAQIEELDSQIVGLGRTLPKIAAKLTETAENFRKFKEAYASEAPTTFSESLRREREKNFQFKGPIESGQQSVVMGLLELYEEHQKSDYLEGGVLEEVGLDGCKGTNDFEINIPVHKILGDEFKAMFERIFPNHVGKGAAVQSCQVFTTAYEVRASSVGECVSSRLCENLLVFRHDGKISLDPANWLESPDEPTWVSNMQAVMPYLGRMFLLLRSETHEDFNVFDCTYCPPHHLGQLRQWASRAGAAALKCMVENDGRNVVYYVFTFPAWRQ